MAEEAEPSGRRWTRRDWIRTSAAAGAGAAAGAVGAYTVAKILAPPIQVTSEIRDAILYNPEFPSGSLRPWWASRAGMPMRVTDFEEWQGAPGVWRGVFESNEYVNGTGFPVLAIRIRRDDAVFQSPPNVIMPSDVSLFYDDADRDLRIVVLYDRCTHLCCIPGWHVKPVPSYFKDYTIAPAVQVYGQDPIWCECHDAQFDPMVLVEDRHANGAGYVGARVVRGPAKLALPVVPVRSASDVLTGEMVDSRWYVSYCR